MIRRLIAHLLVVAMVIPYGVSFAGLNNYTLTKEFVGSANGVINQKFSEMIAAIEGRSDEELRTILLDEVKRVDALIVEGGARLDAVEMGILRMQQETAMKLALSDSPKAVFHADTIKVWKAVQKGLAAAGTSLVYADMAIAGVVGMPVTATIKFTYGVIKGNKLERPEHGDVFFNQFVDGIYANGMMSPILLSLLLVGLSSPVLPLAVFVGINSLIQTVVAGICYEQTTSEEVEFCGNVLAIQEFFARITNEAAYAGAELNMFLTKISPVLRKKDVVSAKVCKHPKRSMRVANRVMVRHGDTVRSYPGVIGVSVGTTADHPISGSCGSLIVKVSQGVDVDMLRAVFGNVLDGVFVEYVK